MHLPSWARKALSGAALGAIFDPRRQLRPWARANARRGAHPGPTALPLDLAAEDRRRCCGAIKKRQTKPHSPNVNRLKKKNQAQRQDKENQKLKIKNKKLAETGNKAVGEKNKKKQSEKIQNNQIKEIKKRRAIIQTPTESVQSKPRLHLALGEAAIRLRRPTAVARPSRAARPIENKPSAVAPGPARHGPAN